MENTRFEDFDYETNPEIDSTMLVYADKPTFVVFPADAETLVRAGIPQGTLCEIKPSFDTEDLREAGISQKDFDSLRSAYPSNEVCNLFLTAFTPESIRKMIAPVYKNDNHPFWQWYLTYVEYMNWEAEQMIASYGIED